MTSPLMLKSIPVFVAFLFVFVFTGSAAGFQVEWRPVTPEELAMKEPKVEKDADAEAIFWETRFDDSKLSKLSISHYVRLKIFTERGREKFSKVDIPFTKGKKVENVSARVIKQDGSIVNLKPEDIFEREIAKAGKAKFKAKSFAVPGIDIGVIVEYKYDETIKDDSISGERLRFQRDIPMQKVTYYVKPYEGTTLRFSSFNLPELRFLEDKKHFHVATLEDVPAEKDEPFMPPSDEVVKWVYLRYTRGTEGDMWATTNLIWSTVLKKLSKPNKEVKQLAASLASSAATDEEKVRNIYNYVQKEIKNISYDDSLTDEERDKIKIKDADDVLRQKMGSPIFIDLLFASLARAAGFEVNLVLSADRSENFFSPNKYPFDSFIEPSSIAVKIGKDWRFFHPGIPYLGFEQLPWYQEWVTSMLVGDGGFIWKATPNSSYEKSAAKRTAKLKLNADGSIEGTARFEFTGHQAINRRRDDFKDSPAKREENFKEEIRRRISTAEITDLKVENFDDNSKPLVYSFNVKIPNYSQKAGRRLLVQPGFFEYGSSPAFSSSDRTYDIYFSYPWSEYDDVEITLPKGFALDTGDAPGEVADGRKIGYLKVEMTIDQESNVLKYKRNFHFGGGGNILFTLSNYPLIKKMFDEFHQADMHTIAIRQQAVE